MKERAYRRTCAWIGGAVAFCVLSLLPVLVGAAPLPLPPRPTPTATPTLTPMPTWTPTPGPTPTPGSVDPQGWIRLNVRRSPGTDANLSALWTAMEWQDAQGAWHAVDGWRGALDEVAGGVGSKTWSVPASLFGQGPFRWIVYAERGGASIVRSDLFRMPERAGTTVTVDVTLEGAAPAATPLLPSSGGALWGGWWPWAALISVGLLACALAGRLQRAGQGG